MQENWTRTRLKALQATKEKGKDKIWHALFL